MRTLFEEMAVWMWEPARVCKGLSKIIMGFTCAFCILCVVLQRFYGPLLKSISCLHSNELARKLQIFDGFSVVLIFLF